MPRRKQPSIPDELLDQLLNGSDPRSALADGGQLAVLGMGEPGLQQALVEAAARTPRQVHVTVGFNEQLAQRIEPSNKIDPFGIERLPPCEGEQALRELCTAPSRFAHPVAHARTRLFALRPLKQLHAVDDHR